MSIWTNCVGTISLHCEDKFNFSKFAKSVLKGEDFTLDTKVYHDDSDWKYVKIVVHLNIRAEGVAPVLMIKDLLNRAREQADYPQMFLADFEINTRIII